MPPLTYLDFDLQIEREGLSFRAQVVRSPVGEAEAAFTYPFTEEGLENLVLKIGHLRGRTRGGYSEALDAARELGQKLFDSVFAGEVRACLRSSIDAADSQGSGLRIRLRLHDAGELVDLPWEFLYDSSLGRFFAQSNYTPIVRYIEMPQRIRPLAVALPLRILVMVSSPDDPDYPKLDVDQEKSRLLAALKPVLDAGKVQIEWLERATLSELQQRLRLADYHVFHYIGHGGFDPRLNQGLLILEDDQGRSQPAPTFRLGPILHDHRALRLAVLNSCEGARNSRTDPFAGVATSLIRQGIPAVVAMQFEISDMAAVTFASGFYSALADGLPVDASLAEARKAILVQPNDVEWGTPVLYMRSPDGVLFDVTATAPLTPAPVSPVAFESAEPTIPPATAVPAPTQERVVPLEAPVHYVEPVAAAEVVEESAPEPEPELAPVTREPEPEPARREPPRPEPVEPPLTLALKPLDADGGKEAAFDLVIHNASAQNLDLALEPHQQDDLVAFTMPGKVAVAAGAEVKQRVVVRPKRRRLGGGTRSLPFTVTAYGDNDQPLATAHGDVPDIPRSMLPVVGGGLLAFGAVAAALAAFLLGGGDDPTPSLPTERILYASNRAGSEQIFAVDVLEGGATDQLTNANARNGLPSVRNYGSFIYFVSERTSISEVWRMDLDGSNERLIETVPGWKLEPDISPDEDSLVLEVKSAVRPGLDNFDIWTVNVDGTEGKNLTNTPEIAEIDPVWSPDGTKIAYATNRDNDHEIYVMDADGSNQKRLTFLNGFDGEPAWSPEGDYIAFNSYRVTDSNIYIVKADGSELPRPVTSNPGHEWDPVWSPDGNQIAYTQDVPNRDDLSDIYITTLDGSVTRRLTDGPGKNTKPAWVFVP